MRKIKVFTGQAHKLELEVNQFVTSRNLAIIDLKITGDEVHCVMILIYDELWYREASSLFFIWVISGAKTRYTLIRLHLKELIIE